jgi:two-component system, cell cycle sensor histidine kinase and response regulator CckA
LVDITERKLGEEALQLSQERYRNLFQSMDEGFMLCEMIDDKAGRPVDFRLLEMNSAFGRNTKLGLDQVLGRTVKEFLPNIEPSWIDFCVRVVQTGLPERLEGRVEGLGRQVSAHAWRADSKRIAIAFTDVTALRQSEDQLRIAQRMESIGRLAGGIAHDFNNLLTVILNYTGFAVDEMAGEAPSRAHLAEVSKAAERAATLTRQLLAFSRKQVMQPQVLDLNKIIAGMEGMLRSLLGEDLVLSVVPAMGLAHVMADPGQVEQVVMNLAVNARDAMANGGRLTIETANTEVDEAGARSFPGLRPGPHVRLTVTDTGTGMDEKTRTQLFEPFFTTKRTGKGTGLGLATVYGIVRQSEGAIGVRSEPGEGTTFTVLLPRELSVTPTPVRTATVPAQPAGAETILVVEDEAAVRKLVERILRSTGYTVLTAASGAEALQVCQQQQGAVHLVLTDVIMPEMGGRDLAGHLKQLYSHMRVVFMSGYTREAIQDRGVLEPGMHFIGKPFSPAELRHIVRQVLDGETP